MKNIGIVLPGIPGYSETFIKNKIKGLVKSGFKVFLCVNQSLKNKADLPKQIKICSMGKVDNYLQVCFSIILLFFQKPSICVKFISLERKSGRHFFRIVKNLIISRHILILPLDIVHFEFATMALNRENIAAAMNATSLVSLRGFDIGLYPYTHPNCYNLLWKKVNHIHTISNDLYQRALNLGLSNKISITKINPAIDYKFFNSPSSEKLNTPLRILSIGRLEWKKGFEYLIYALHLLKKRGINFTCRIIGAGSYYEAIQFSISQLGLNEEITLSGQLAPIEVKNSLEWTDIYMQPSIQEGFCNAVLEAQAMGCLCIVTDADGLSENVMHNKTGFVVKRRSSVLLFDAILKILDMSSKERKKIRQNAILRVQENFNLSKQGNEFSQLYNRL